MIGELAEAVKRRALETTEGKKMAKEMTHRIWKFEVPVTDNFSLPLPRGAEFLSVQVQHGVVCAWFKVDPAQDVSPRRFRVVGTGHPCEGTGLRFLGTFQLNGGALVFHLFAEV